MIAGLWIREVVTRDVVLRDVVVEMSFDARSRSDSSVGRHRVRVHESDAAQSAQARDVAMFRGGATRSGVYAALARTRRSRACSGAS